MKARLEIASRVLTGMMANPNFLVNDHRCGWRLCNMDEKQAANYALHVADALLNADTETDNFE